jgi:hypothetical protein
MVFSRKLKFATCCCRPFTEQGDRFELPELVNRRRRTDLGNRERWHGIDEALDVRAVRGADPAIEALDYAQKLSARGRRVTARRSRLGGERVDAPLGHVTDRWRRLVFEGRKDINAGMYEVAAFEGLNNGLRSGDLYVLGSRRYQTFESYLLTKEHWAQLKETGRTRLALGGTAAEYLEGRRQHLDGLLAKLARDVDSVENVTVDEKGELHLTALDTVVPEAAKRLQRRLERRIPLISLTDLLNEVDRWTGFLGHFTHLVSAEVPEGERRQMLIAAVRARLGLDPPWPYSLTPSQCASSARDALPYGGHVRGLCRRGDHLRIQVQPATAMAAA